MNEVLEKIASFLHEFNLQTIISMGLIVWYFTRDIKSSIDNLDKDIRGMNTRVSRLEGGFYGKEAFRLTEKEEKNI
jgi:hypothetical protein